MSAPCLATGGELRRATRCWPRKSNSVCLGSYVSRANARREIAGTRPEFWQRGQWQEPYSSMPPSARFASRFASPLLERCRAPRCAVIRPRPVCCAGLGRRPLRCEDPPGNAGCVIDGEVLSRPPGQSVSFDIWRNPLPHQAKPFEPSPTSGGVVAAVTEIGENPSAAAGSGLAPLPEARPVPTVDGPRLRPCSSTYGSQPILRLRRPATGADASTWPAPHFPLRPQSSVRRSCSAPSGRPACTQP